MNLLRKLWENVSKKSDLNRKRKESRMALLVVCHEGQSQPATTCSNLTIETLEQGAKYVQS